MEHLIAVVVVLGVATLVTGLLLPLTTRRGDTQRVGDERDEALVAEASVWR